MASEEHWALLRSMLRITREIGQQVTLYSQLRYIAAEEGWKPGWAAHFYKSLHGVWPAREWEKVPPVRPPEEVYQIVQRRQRSYRQQMRRYHEERMADHERRGVEDGEATGIVHEGHEGVDRMRDDRRMQGMEEQDECPGELRETDE